MADTDGVVKLADAIEYLDVVGMWGLSNADNRLLAWVKLADGDKNEILCSAYLDRDTSVMWVQLPLPQQEAIVSQARPQPPQGKLDGRPASHDANTVPAEAPAQAGTGKRRAWDSCHWHHNIRYERYANPGEWIVRCPYCGQGFSDPRRSVMVSHLNKLYERDDVAYPLALRRAT